MVKDHVDHVVNGSSWSKGKECCLQTPTCHPLYPFAAPCLRLSFTGPYCSFVIMECNMPPTLRKEFPISPAILLRSPSFLDVLQALCWTVHPPQGTQNAPVSNICTGPGETWFELKCHVMAISFGPNDALIIGPHPLLGVLIISYRFGHNQ